MNIHSIGMFGAPGIVRAEGNWHSDISICTKF
jgi:hypothetical protein